MHGQRHWEGAHTRMSWPIDNVEFPNKVLWSASKGSTIVKRSYYLSKLQTKEPALVQKGADFACSLTPRNGFPGRFQLIG